VGPVAVVILQEFLILALQALLENDAPDVEAAVLVSGAGPPPAGTSNRGSSRG
jgi:hypothetical protein